MSYYPGQGYNGSQGGQYGGGGGQYGGQGGYGGGGGGYAPPSGPPPSQNYGGQGGYAPPPGPPSGYGGGGGGYAPPSGPPPSQGYGGGGGGYGGQGGYAPPSGPPPSQNYGGGGGYSSPSGPPPSQNYGGQGGYAPPSGPPPGQRGQNRYAPPNYPPPAGLDAYGYPLPVQNAYSASHGRAGPPPPSAPQQFGHGAPEGYTFQYSNCSGRRKALLIGINYFGTDAELRGCINDVHNVSNFLTERYGYKREDMVILTDDQSNPVMIPTKANIIRAMGWLIKDARPNDALFLHYSGHGGQVEDEDGDEEDGSDECIYPVDFKQNGEIIDDMIHTLVVKPLQPGVRLTAIFDSCHSATVMDLPYVYSTKGILKEPNLAKEAGQGLLTAISSYAQGDVSGAASSIFGLAKSAFTGDGAYKKTKATRTSPADVIMWSGSKDDQTSADATINSQATGAMSWAFISAIKANPKQSYVQLLNSVREILETKYTQKPQLSCSHPLDTDLLFVM